MSVIKERIIGAVSIMNETDAEKVWNLITDIFPSRSWADIEEVEPDETDLEILRSAATDPDCSVFVSNADAMAELGL